MAQWTRGLGGQQQRAAVGGCADDICPARAFLLYLQKEEIAALP